MWSYQEYKIPEIIQLLPPAQLNIKKAIHETWISTMIYVPETSDCKLLKDIFNQRFDLKLKLPEAL